MFLEYVSHPIGLLASIVLLFKLFIKKTKAMKSNNFAATIIKAVLPVFALLLSTQLFAQVTYTSRSATSEINVKGTSNLHDWSMKGKDYTCFAQFTVNSATAGTLVSLNGLSLSIPVKSLKSGENLLDTRAYKAMNADKYTHVNFKMTTAVVTSLGGNKYTIKATGPLTIAGVSKEMTLTATGTLNADGTITVTGSTKFKMTDFGIKPPQFMMGALKTGNDLTIEYNVKFNGK